MKNKPPLPLADYLRIYQVIHGVIATVDGKSHRAHRACSFFTIVGAVILRDRYRLEASISAGMAAYKLNEQDLLFFGRKDEERLVADGDAFHAWIQLEGWAIDFMAPLFTDIAKEEGRSAIPRKAFMRRLSEMKDLHELSRPGDFMLHHDPKVASDVIDHWGEVPAHHDLKVVAERWFERPPKPLSRNIAVADSDGGQLPLTVTAPAIAGSW